MYGVSQLIELISPPLLLLNAQFNRLIVLRFYNVLILNFFPGCQCLRLIIQFTLCTWMWCFYIFLFTCVTCVRINDDDDDDDDDEKASTYVINCSLYRPCCSILISRLWTTGVFRPVDGRNTQTVWWKIGGQSRSLNNTLSVLPRWC